MPTFAATDLRAFCRDLGVPVTFAGVSVYPDTGEPVKGLLDQPTQNRGGDQGFGGIDITVPELRLPFNAFSPMPRNKQAITVDGVAYTIADTSSEDDGAFLCFGLKLAAA